MDHTEGILQQKLARKLEKNKDKKLNLICRMAGNIYSKARMTPKEAAKFAFAIYEEVSKRLEEE